MRIKQNEKEITFTYPLWQKRVNPYMEDGADCGEYPTFTGLIVHNKNGLDEIGFAYTIDMDYKGKGDQVGSFAVMWEGDEESFIAKCKELEIDYEIMDFSQ